MMDAQKVNSANTGDASVVEKKKRYITIGAILLIVVCFIVCYYILNTHNKKPDIQWGDSLEAAKVVLATHDIAPFETNAAMIGYRDEHFMDVMGADALVYLTFDENDCLKEVSATVAVDDLDEFYQRLFHEYGNPDEDNTIYTSSIPGLSENMYSYDWVTDQTLIHAGNLAAMVVVTYEPYP